MLSPTVAIPSNAVSPVCVDHSHFPPHLLPSHPPLTVSPPHPLPQDRLSLFTNHSAPARLPSTAPSSSPPATLLFRSPPPSSSPNSPPPQIRPPPLTPPLTPPSSCPHSPSPHVRPVPSFIPPIPLPSKPPSTSCHWRKGELSSRIHVVTPCVEWACSQKPTNAHSDSVN